MASSILSELIDEKTYSNNEVNESIQDTFTAEGDVMLSNMQEPADTESSSSMQDNFLKKYCNYIVHVTINDHMRIRR
jgi:hypothetical protein